MHGTINIKYLYKYSGLSFSSIFISHIKFPKDVVPLHRNFIPVLTAFDSNYVAYLLSFIKYPSNVTMFCLRNFYFQLQILNELTDFTGFSTKLNHWGSHAVVAVNN